MLLRGVNAVGYTSYADNVVNAFVAESRMAGVDIFRVFDSLNYIDNLKFGIDSVHRGNGVAEGTICYTGDVSDPNKKKVSHCIVPMCNPAVLLLALPVYMRSCCPDPLFSCTTRF